MNLVEIFEKDKNIYNHFVSNNETGSFLQSYEWGQWQQALGRQGFRFLVLGDSKETVATIQMVKMPLPFGKYYLYAPYGPVTNLGFKIEDLGLLTQKIKQQFPDAVFVKIEPKTAYSIQHSAFRKSTNIQPAKTLVINLDQTEEQLLSQMHHKTRYNIRLAQKHGVEVQKDLVVTPGHGLYFKEVVDQIAEIEKRQEFVGHGSEYYKKFLNFFGLQNQNSEVKVTVYKALFQKQLLVSAIMLDFGTTRTYLFGGSSAENKNLMAPYLLHYRAMLDAKEQGVKFYDFWGIETSSGKTPGFARFKQGFGGEIKTYSGAYDFVVSPVWYGLYKTLKFVKKVIKK